MELTHAEEIVLLSEDVKVDADSFGTLSETEISAEVIILEISVVITNKPVVSSAEKVPGLVVASKLWAVSSEETMLEFSEGVNSPIVVVYIVSICVELSSMRVVENSMLTEFIVVLASEVRISPDTV
jgi:hypothetical protein